MKIHASHFAWGQELTSLRVHFAIGLLMWLSINDIYGHFHLLTGFLSCHIQSFEHTKQQTCCPGASGSFKTCSEERQSSSQEFYRIVIHGNGQIMPPKRTHMNLYPGDQLTFQNVFSQLVCQTFTGMCTGGFLHSELCESWWRISSNCLQDMLSFRLSLE